MLDLYSVKLMIFSLLFCCCFREALTVWRPFSHDVFRSCRELEQKRIQFTSSGICWQSTFLNTDFTSSTTSAFNFWSLHTKFKNKKPVKKKSKVYYYKNFKNNIIYEKIKPTYLVRTVIFFCHSCLWNLFNALNNFIQIACKKITKL